MKQPSTTTRAGKVLMSWSGIHKHHATEGKEKKSSSLRNARHRGMINRFVIREEEIRGNGSFCWSCLGKSSGALLLDMLEKGIEKTANLLKRNEVISKSSTGY